MSAPPSVSLGAVKGGFAADVLHQAAGGIAAEERALWPLQDLHALDVEQGEGLRLGNGNVAFVQVHRIGCLDDVVEIVLGDAADRELGVLPGECPTGVHARHEGDDVAARLDVEGLHLVAGEGADRYADILDVLVAFLRRDDDLVKDCCLGGQGRKCHREYGEDRPGVRRQGQFVRHA